MVAYDEIKLTRKYNDRLRNVTILARIIIQYHRQSFHFIAIVIIIMGTGP